MFGNFVGRKATYNSDVESNSSNEESHPNASLVSPGRPNFYRRESKVHREIKMQRAVSLIQDANFEEAEMRWRNKPQYHGVRFLIFPDDTVKVFWDIIMVL